MAVDIADLLTPRFVVGCPVAIALAAVGDEYRGQFDTALKLITDTPEGRPAPVRQEDVCKAFRRLGQNVPDRRLRDHVRGRCGCV